MKPSDAAPHAEGPDAPAPAAQPGDGTPDAADLAADAAYAHEEAIRRADTALRTYTLSEDGWRTGPSATLQRMLADLLHWCDDTQRDFGTVLARARELHATERGADA